ncbi:MAG TPA: type II secretion system protein GspC [Desulfobacterales bacterium]|nr:type II secretion system protein GspC [Desulfobacterales bacterium]
MKRYFTLLNVLLITAAVFFMVKAFYKVAGAKIDHATPSKAAARHVVPNEASTRHPLSDYRDIIERNLFKTKTGTGGRPEKLDIESLTPTDLKLKLLGTVTGDEKEAYAVIEDTDVKRQNLYKIGDTIQNATLKMILREKVVLHVNGKDEILGIEKVREERKTDRSSERKSASSSRNIAIKRSQIDTALQDVNTLMKQVRIQPHFQDGKPDGLRLTGVRPNSIFYKMGLKSGDIIVGVDGKNIESVDDALKFYQSLQSASKVQLQLKRRGRPKTIDYNIE